MALYASEAEGLLAPQLADRLLAGLLADLTELAQLADRLLAGLLADLAELAAYRQPATTGTVGPVGHNRVCMAQLGLGAATALAMLGAAAALAMPAVAVVVGTACGTPDPPLLRLEGVAVGELFGRADHLPSLIKVELAQVAQLCLTCAWLHT